MVLQQVLTTSKRPDTDLSRIKNQVVYSAFLCRWFNLIVFQ